MPGLVYYPGTGVTLHKLPDSRYAHINVRGLIPGGKIHHAGLGQAKDGLEFPHRRGGSRSVNAIRVYPGNRSVDRGNGI